MITKRIAWITWLVGSIFYAYQYILRVMPNIMINDILDHFNIGTGLFGQFSGVYYIGYALMHLPLGILLDRVGPRKVMTACILLTALGSLPIIYADNWVYPFIGRVLVGMGSSAAILGVFKIIRLGFEERQFTRMLSFAVTIGLIGAIYGGGPVNYLNAVFGYKLVIQLLAVAGIALSVITYFIVPENQGKTTTSIAFNLKSVFSNYRVILICIFAGLMVGPLEGFADVWGKEFLVKVYHLDGNLAATLTSMTFIGMCFGAPALSFIAAKTRSDFGTIIASALIMALCFMLLLIKAVNVEGMSILFIVIGVFCAYQIMAIYKAATYVTESTVGLTTAVTNMIIMSFGYFFHSIIGILIEYFGGKTSSEAFIYGISIIPIALFIAAVGFIGLSIFNHSKVTSHSA